MSVFTLKLIALITMIIDHYGAIFRADIQIYRIIGRIAFPIYSFLLVEGYFHTKDIKKYARRLLLFAFISEIPFDLAFNGRIEFMHQNIFFTLFIGLMTMYFIDNQEKYKVNKRIIIILAMLLATVLSVDYSFIGIVYILSFYFTRHMDINRRMIIVGTAMLVINFSLIGFTQQFAIFSLLLIYLYNGELGPRNKFLQALFYIMYPLHLLIFYFLIKL